jgi:hypothetical protein
MSRTNRTNARCPRIIDLVLDEDLEFHPELVPVDEYLSDSEVRVLLDAVIRAHRWQLVSTARHHLGNRRRDAEDIVQDVCLEALQGLLALSRDPSEALDDLLQEIIARCDGGAL